MFLTTKYVLPSGRTEKHYNHAVSGGRETGLYPGCCPLLDTTFH